MIPPFTLALSYFFVSGPFIKLYEVHSKPLKNKETVIVYLSDETSEKKHLSSCK